MYHPYTQALTALYPALIPEMILLFVACLLFLGGTFRPGRQVWGLVAVAGLIVSLLVLIAQRTYQTDAGAVDSANGLFVVPFLFDSLSSVARVLAFVSGIVFVLLSWHELPERQAADHHACLLLIVAGTGLVGAANDLIALFLALELVSIPTYIILYLPRHDEASQEAALKYFLLSIFSSALLLFGFSYLFGLAGTTNIAGILQVLYRSIPAAAEVQATAGMAQIALLMIVAGLGFRVTVVPFHFYAPDVYQGTSTSGAALLAFIPKLAGFAALLRVLGFVIPPGVVLQSGRHLGLALSDQVPILLWFLAVFTMFGGNLLALLQDNLKRLLAYSSVAHAGYMLVALASAPYLAGHAGSHGVAALLFYLVAYGAMTIGVFTVIAMLDTPERPIETVDDLAGLSKSHPGTALMLAILLFSLIGIPLTAGFTGKLLVFFGAVSVSGPLAHLYTVLALIGVINAAIGAWYYLRIVAVMYLRTSVKPIEAPPTIPGLAALALCVVLTVGVAVPPGANLVLDIARRTAPAPTFAPPFPPEIQAAQR
jgi:NADH-quinone oxidoreductase subunit N